MFCQTVVIYAGLHNIKRYISDTILHIDKKTAPNFPEREQLVFACCLRPPFHLVPECPGKTDGTYTAKQVRALAQNRKNEFHGYGPLERGGKKTRTLSFYPTEYLFWFPVWFCRNMIHRELIPRVMGFYVVNAITVNCKIVQLSAETTHNFCRYQNFDAIAKSSQDIKWRGVTARCM